jgi:hypothetical protein
VQATCDLDRDSDDQRHRAKYKQVEVRGIHVGCLVRSSRESVAYQKDYDRDFRAGKK